jgi:methionyl-tRNA formyltransferase
MRIAFAGTPEFAVPALAALRASRHELVGVLTQPDRPAGRGRHVEASPVKQFAVAAGIPVDQPVTLRTEAGRAGLRGWAPELLVVVAYGLILPPEALAIPSRGCLNIHGSLLPRWRGAAPIQRALLAGDTVTGVTIMLMDAGLDTGPMLLERPWPIGPADTSATLHDALATLGAEALLEAIAGLESGAIQPRPQPAEGATYAPKVAKVEARIDWNEAATLIDRRIRAYQPWPVAETALDGEQLRLHEARPVSDAAASRPHGVAPGTVLGLRDGALVVACGEGCLALVRLQRAGRRAVTAREFANGLALDGQVLR